MTMRAGSSWSGSCEVEAKVRGIAIAIAIANGRSGSSRVEKTQNNGVWSFEDGREKGVNWGARSEGERAEVKWVAGLAALIEMAGGATANFNFQPSCSFAAATKRRAHYHWPQQSSQ